MLYELCLKRSLVRLGEHWKYHKRQMHRPRAVIKEVVAENTLQDPTLTCQDGDSYQNVRQDSYHLGKNHHESILSVLLVSCCLDGFQNVSTFLVVKIDMMVQT